jgi:hypothetical protein
MPEQWYWMDVLEKVWTEWWFTNISGLFFNKKYKTNLELFKVSLNGLSIKICYTKEIAQDSYILSFIK